MTDDNVLRHLRLCAPPPEHWHDIPGMLRATAERIERGEEGRPLALCAVLLDASGRLTVYGWGETPNHINTIGILTAGAQMLGVEHHRRQHEADDDPA